MQGGVCLLRGGVYLPGEGVSARHLWTEFLTDTCENITFPQLRLRAVMREIGLRGGGAH